ncbi:c-type cytochrome [Tropicibacter naphthalenivorans]|uniref:Cytochrome c, mono-and diheme variants n=1 Tax=Tropicibacter naphthalenivorans TaxID=441103 RepID=A0A0P1GAZ1_9RHOB|nr:c-type cytochrome [Tropicibacter naphthalenivorans]CUH78594.1 Cytochrome c, mono-and diheme variants [Tropicibacter naphthalenivorans]SMC80998.1 Cytochrome c [Tropicibacter naphthalenivorans]
MIRLAALTLMLATPVLAQDADVGRGHFYTHCATCHGLEGRGDGPMSGVLMIQPTNLTELAAQNGGSFPLDRVVKRIDGRDPLVSHGSPMPVYGDYFEGLFDVPINAPDNDPVLTSRPVVDLVAYLMEIQHPD